MSSLGSRGAVDLGRAAGAGFTLAAAGAGGRAVLGARGGGATDASGATSEVGSTGVAWGGGAVVVTAASGERFAEPASPAGWLGAAAL